MRMTVSGTGRFGCGPLATPLTPVSLLIHQSASGIWTSPKFHLLLKLRKKLAEMLPMRRSRAKAKAIDLKPLQQRLALAAVSAFAIVSLLLLIRP
jgi:hypothetical protein